MSSIVEYYFDSDSRTSGSNESPVFELDHPIARGFWKLKQVEIPFSYYVNDSSANTLTFNDGTSRQVSIAAGNYDGNTLAVDLQTALNASASLLTFTVTYNSENYKFTISGSSTFTINWTSDSGLGSVMGFDVSSDDSGASSYVSDNASNLSGDNFIFLKSNALHPGGIVNGKRGNHIVTRIPVTTSSGGLIVYNGREDRTRLMTIHAYEIDFELTDKDGNILDLNGLPWSLTLEIQK